ncbi:MAG TPA: hypothetical protein VFF28_02880 [Candidatus Nanoarchaeia archaeon]|nr:hypothetical protein [Candidatus Nanoarchaeia archaeon]
MDRTLTSGEGATTVECIVNLPSGMPAGKAREFIAQMDVGHWCGNGFPKCRDFKVLGGTGVISEETLQIRCNRDDVGHLQRALPEYALERYKRNCVYNTQ